MSPKQTETIENPPLVSSSEEEEEEEEESGSSGEDSETSGEDSKKDDSSDDDQLKPKQTISASITLTKLESDSDCESDSDSDPKPIKKKHNLNTIVNKPKAESSRSDAIQPENSTSKRLLKQTDDEAKKKVKTDHDEVKKISGEEAKKMFQRLFSETDEIALLQGILDFNGDISEDMNAFCQYVKKLINFNANKSQIVTKIQRLKKKFVNIVKKSLKKGKGEDQIKFSKDLDQKSFDLSRKIWGNEGVLAYKSRKKLGGGSSKEIKIKIVHSPKKQIDLCSSKDIALFFKGENVSVFGLDESLVTSGWDLVEDGVKKREIEERLKKIKTRQMELCLQRTSLVDVAVKTIFKDNASSSS